MTIQERYESLTDSWRKILKENNYIDSKSVSIFGLSEKFLRGVIN